MICHPFSLAVQGLVLLDTQKSLQPDLSKNHFQKLLKWGFI